MSIDHALWVHGLSAEIEYPDLINSKIQKGYSVSIQGKPSTSNWLHFAVPTPEIVDDRRMRPQSVLFRYKKSGGGSIAAVHLYDGETKITSDDNPAESVGDEGWNRIRVKVKKGVNGVHWGIGISIKLTFDSNGGKVDFDSAGCDFVKTTQIASQRFRIRTSKRHLMEFPYRSNMPIDIPNNAIDVVPFLLDFDCGMGF